MEKYKGVSIYEGIVIAKPFLKKKKNTQVKIYKIIPEMVKSELERLNHAIKETKQEIKSLIESLAGKVNQNELKILNVHLMMLEDPVFLSDISNKIKIELLNSEKVVETVVKKYVGMFKSLNDPVYKQRAADVEDVGEKIIQNLQSEKAEIIDVGNKILITKELKPSELLKYHNLGLKLSGIISEYGGETSHAAILAKTLGIPTLMGVKNLNKIKFNENEEVILDSRSEKELFLINPEFYIKQWYEKEKKESEDEELEIKTFIDFEALSKDNVKVNLYSNMGSEVELDDILKYKPDGIGLLRTEFLYMDSDHFPTEEEQLEEYKRFSETIGVKKELIIRTLDIGADKKLSYFEMPEEENPFLGVRAIRLSLAHKNIFKTQLRAILRAAVFGNIKLMYPMISSIDELRKANEILNQVKNDLEKEEIKYKKNLEVGIMIEVPSSAIMSDLLIKEVDFFSIGTNDLTQYVLAADRLSEEVSYIYNNYDPSVLRMINIVAENAIKAEKKVSVCGEMGGDKLGLLAFLSFGIRDLSMLPSFIPKIKKVLKKIEIKDLKDIKTEILKAKTAEDVKKILNDYLLGVI